MAQLEWLGGKGGIGDGLRWSGAAGWGTDACWEVLVGGSELLVGHRRKNLSGELLAT